MYKIRLRAALNLTLITSIAAYMMQVFLGVFFARDLVENFTRLKIFNIVVIVLEVTANIIFWRVLSPLEDAVNAREKGLEVSEEVKRKARRSGYGSTMVILGTIVVAFFIGPIGGMIGNVAAGIDTYSAVEAIFILLINLSIGAMTGTHCILSTEAHLRGPMESLGVYRLEEGDRYISLRGRIMLPAVSALLLSSCLFAGAGLGYLSAGTDQPGIIASFLVETTILSLAILAWGSWLTWKIAADVSQRLRQLSGRIEQLSGGTGELGTRINIARNDDIGRMASAFNGFMGMMSSLVGKIRVQAVQSEDSGKRLAEGVERARQSVGAMEDTLGQSRAATEGQGQVVSGAKERIGQIASSISVVADMVSNQAGFVAQSSAAVSEMAANIGSVTRTACRADEVAANLDRLSEEGGAALQAALVHIRELQGVSQSATAVVSAISKIASQTNLLAMNAAIEAAHAGSAGLGFAVVANEVRSLAESAARSAREAGALIKDMASRVETGVALADKAGESFQRIKAEVGETAGLVRAIAGSMEEQKTGADEILESVGSLTQATQAIQDHTGNERREADGMMRAMEEIVASAQRISASIDEELKRAEELAKAVDDVYTEAAANARGSAELSHAVADFKD